MQFITPFSGARKAADLLKTNLANAVCSLFKFGFNPTPATLKAELEAQECDFTDYTTKTITAWTGPVLAPSSGYQLNGGLVEWIVVTPTVTNIVGGYWIENAAGDVMQIVKFDPPGVTMAVADDPTIVTPVVFVPAQTVSG